MVGRQWNVVVSDGCRARWTRIAPTLLLVIAIVAAIVWLAGTRATGRSAIAGVAPRRPPATRVLFGVQLDPTSASTGPEAYARRLGRVPAIYGIYASVPLRPHDQASIASLAHRIGRLGASMMLTLGPRRGLSRITPRSADQLAVFVARVSAITPLFVRFGWEMNGSWYPWGQQPHAFVRAFREVADAVHRRARRASMVWAPNVGTGYPFPDGSYSPRRGSVDFQALDTNRDGHVDASDDPYAPYWPGRRAVDWVGLTLTYYGRRWPWTRNVIPEPGSFRAQLMGTYDGAGGDWRHVPDFYARYAAAADKPFMIAETSALYLPRVSSGATDLQIKERWWHEVFAPDTPATFPHLRAILWFEPDKYEPDQRAYVSWAITDKAELVTAFRRAIPPWLGWARDLPAASGRTPAQMAR